MTVKRDNFPVLPLNYQAVREKAAQFKDIDVEAVETNMELVRLAGEMFADGDNFFARFKISRARFMTLVTLAQSPPEGLKPSELADAMQVTRATMTGLIDTLEQAKYVKRQDDPADRRVYRVVLTPGGNAFLDKVLPVNFRRAGVLMSRLSSRERAELVRLLHKVSDGLHDFRRQSAAAEAKALGSK